MVFVAARRCAARASPTGRAAGKPCAKCGPFRTMENREDDMLKTAFTYDNALAHVEANALSGIAANFNALAAGSIAFMIGQTWADKDNRKPVDDIKADILARFKDSGDKKSKAYEFGALSLTIARELSRGTMTADNAWSAELRDIVQDADSCLEDGIRFLADRFHSVAQNVSGLARHFKGEKEKKPKAVNFMDALEKLVEKTIEDGQQVPVSAAMDMLLACGEVSPQDTN